MKEKEPQSIEKYKKNLKSWWDEDKKNWWNESKQEWEEDNKGFKSLYIEAINNLKTPSKAEINRLPKKMKNLLIEVNNEWRNRDITGLCNFFKEWYNHNLTPENKFNELDYILRFSMLYFKNEEGLDFVKSFGGRTMILNFIELRAQKMNSSVEYLEIKNEIESCKDCMEDFLDPDEEEERKGYNSFNEFFTRRIKKSARPIDEEIDSIIAPTDCIFNIIETNLLEESQIPVKSRKISIKKLLNDSSHANKFYGGAAVSCIVMPHTYHRFHSPVEGNVIESSENVPGNYFGIDNFPRMINKGNVGYEFGYSLFEEFRRGYLIIKTKNFGLVAMIPVGLNTVGSVVFCNEKLKKINNNHPKIQKGEEIGYFQFGGSLIILLFQKDRFIPIEKNFLFGQKIGTVLAS